MSTPFPSLSQFTIKKGYTTSSLPPPEGISQISLADPDIDSLLCIHRLSSTQPPLKIAAVPISPASSTDVGAWEATYPLGSINPGNKDPSVPFGGFGCYMSGPLDFDAEWKDATEVILGYKVMFEEGFEFAKGGKLPGVYGGIYGDDCVYGVTGGRGKEILDAGRAFNLRIMWREKGLGELYAYIPPNAANTTALDRLAADKGKGQGKVVKNPGDYGVSIGRGSFTFEPGKWTSIAIRVKLNDVEDKDSIVANGEIEVFVNSSPVVFLKSIILRTTKESCVQGMHWQTFFGGHSKEWASPKDQKAWFCDIEGGIVA